MTSLAPEPLNALSASIEGQVPDIINVSEAQLAPEESNTWTKRQILVIGVICAIVVVAEVGNNFEIAPQTEIWQDIICREYYGVEARGVGTLDADCKIEPIQTRLAFIGGWKDTLDQVPGILLSIPFGILADRIGRKPVLIISCIGWFLGACLVRIISWWPSIFPLWLIWLTPITQICGGGSSVSTSMLFTMLADTFPPEERMITFYRLMSASLICSVLSPPAAAMLMESTGNWLPYILALACLLMCLLLSFVLPETLVTVQGLRLPTGPTNDDDVSAKNTFTRTMSNFGRKAIDSTYFLRTNNSIGLLIFAFFITTLSKRSFQILIIYVSKRLSWSIPQASYLLSLRGIVYLVLVSAILPLLTHFTVHRHKTPATVLDLRLTQASGLLLTLGSLLIGASPNAAFLIIGIVLFALGSTFDLAVRGLVTSLVHPCHVAALYTTLAVMQSAGMFVAGPLFATTFRWGLLAGGVWRGLPFLVGAALFLFSFVAVLLVKISRERLGPGSGAESEAETEPLLA